MREITEKIGSLGKDQGVDFFARVEFNMNLADRDLTGDLDFYQFCYMSFLTCLDGSYRFSIEGLGFRLASSVASYRCLYLTLLEHCGERKPSPTPRAPAVWVPLPLMISTGVHMSDG
jgi:hypothetical protein